MNPYRQNEARGLISVARNKVGPDRAIGWLVWFVLVGVVLAHELGCTPGQRGMARSALDIAQTLCIIAHQALPDSEVAKACGIADPLFQPMKDVLSGSRTASAQAVAGARTGACGPDAGSSPPK